MILPLAAFLLALSSSLPGGADEEIDRIFSPFAEAGSPGCAVAVIETGEVVYAKGFGEAQLEFGAPITPDTPFHVASVSKQFTAFAVMLLEQAGKLSLDDEVRGHVSRMPDLGEKVTIRQLIHHTSGLRDQWDLLQLAGWRMDDVITHEDVMTLVSRQRALNFTPGERHMYCNTGYTLLAEIVKSNSRMSLREFAEQEIFEPLGMENTHFHDDHTEVVPGRAYSYRRDGAGYRKAVLSYAVVGATSLFTTANDLAQWAGNFGFRDVGGDEAFESLLTRGVLNSGRTLDYAGGINHGEYRGLPTLSHGGADAGFRSFLVIFPEQEVSIAVLGNVSNLNPAGLAYEVADRFLESELEPVSRSGRSSRSTVSGLALKVLAEDPDDPYAGYFVDKFHDQMLQIIMRGGTRTVEVAERSFVLEAAGEGSNRFLIPDDPRLEFIEFVRDSAGAITAAVLQLAGDEPMPLTKVDAASSFRPDRFAGRYFSDELDTHYDLIAGSGRLTLLRRHHDAVELEIRYRDGFTADGHGFHFVRDEQGELTGLLLSTGRVKNLHFRRMPPAEEQAGG